MRTKKTEDMKRYIVLIGILCLSGVVTLKAQQERNQGIIWSSLRGLEYTVKAGINIGGTAPVGRITSSQPSGWRLRPLSRGGCGVSRADGGGEDARRARRRNARSRSAPAGIDLPDTGCAGEILQINLALHPACTIFVAANGGRVPGPAEKSGPERSRPAAKVERR